MFKKVIRKIKFKRFVKTFKLSTYNNNLIDVAFVEDLYPLLYDFTKRNSLLKLVRLLDEETYLCLWYCLLDLKEKYPFMFGNDSGGK